MTREEAINTLGNFKRYISGGGVTDRKANKAIDMAIEALQSEPVKHGREWIKKDEVMDIIKGLPQDLWEEYIYMLKGVW